MDQNTQELAERVQRTLSDRFRNLQVIGEGGMGVVFCGEETATATPVALKVLRPELGSLVNRERFLREGRISATMRHPHIVPVLETRADDGLFFFTMPFVEGETLRARLRRDGPLPLDDALQIVGEVGEALGHAHDHGYIHRDIKPSNILLGEGGAMLADFGVAKTLAEAGVNDLTMSGITIGTPVYMSPEQAAGDKRVDARSDQYSLACVLYEALVGEPPFTGPTSVVVIARHIGDEAPSLSVARPGVPAAVAVAVHRALSKSPADRFSSVEEFVAALRAPAPAAPRRRRWVGPAAVAAVMAAAMWALSVALAPSSLDPRGILVFPLEDPEAAAGDQIATYIGYVLQGTDPLVWREARDWLGAGVAVEDVSTSRRREIAEEAGTRYFIDGSVLRGTDSLTVVLRLNDVESGRVVQRAGRSGPTGASEPRLGARAVGELLGAILEPGHPIDLGALADRSPVAITRFHEGEVEYRRSRFSEALAHYESALEDDSVFALAAVRGAQAAMWLEDAPATSRLASIAIDRQALLPDRYRRLALGIRHRFNGEADEALEHFEFLRRRYPDWAEAEASVGEIHYHYYPSNRDGSGAEHFARAILLDSLFTPPSYHLAELAIRAGDEAGAQEFRSALQRVGSDEGIGLQLTLMTECSERDPDDIDWVGYLARDERIVVSTSQAMASAPHLRPCAAAASGAALNPSGIRRWGAYLVHHGLMVAEGRADDLLALVNSDRVAGLPAHSMLLLDAIALPELTAIADSVYRARMDASDVAASSPNVWLLMHWARHTGRDEDFRRLAGELVDRGQSGDREARLFRDIALALLDAGEPTDPRALDRLASLRPTGTTQDLVWDPWESLVVERLVLARGYAERGSAAEAIDVLTDWPSHRSVMEVWLLPAYERLGRELEAP